MHTVQDTVGNSLSGAGVKRVKIWDMTGSLIVVSQVPNGAEEYYFVKSGAQEGSLTMVLAAASIVMYSW